MWKIISGLPKDEQDITILLRSITDNKKAEIVASTLIACDLHHKSDLYILLAKLDCRLLLAFKTFIENSYNIYLKFTHPEKQPDMSMNDYILEFENFMQKMNNCNMILPDTELAFRIP